MTSTDAIPPAATPKIILKKHADVPDGDLVSGDFMVGGKHAKLYAEDTHSPTGEIKVHTAVWRYDPKQLPGHMRDRHYDRRHDHYTATFSKDGKLLEARAYTSGEIKQYEKHPDRPNLGRYPGVKLDKLPAAIDHLVQQVPAVALRVLEKRKATAERIWGDFQTRLAGLMDRVDPDTFAGRLAQIFTPKIFTEQEILQGAYTPGTDAYRAKVMSALRGVYTYNAKIDPAQTSDTPALCFWRSFMHNTIDAKHVEAFKTRVQEFIGRTRPPASENKSH